MRISELMGHLDNIRRQYGDLEVRVDADLFKDTAPRDITSLSVAAFYVKPISDVMIGQFKSEGVHRVVMYIGNEPKLKL